jgi:hypothetical protein
VPVGPPQDSTIAVVGDGFGSLLVHVTARYVGFGPEQIRIYGPNDLAVGTYQQLAYNLGQTVLRSESESHFLPADWPTFAQLDAWSHFSIKPLLRSIRRKYNPGVPEILTEATVVQRAVGWNDVRVPVKIGWLQREMAPVPHFVLYDEDANMVGRAKHVMLAMGHGPLSFPPVLAAARENAELRERIVQAYEPKRYHPDGRYVVIGAGIASVNEWANALDVGAKVISLLRRPEPDEQDLNAPRCMFEAFGIDAFQGATFDERLRFLGTILKGTTPRRRSWLAKVQQGREEGRFEQIIGEIAEVQAGPIGLRLRLTSTEGDDPGWIDVTGVVAGTGFVKSVLTIPVLRRIAEFYKLPVKDGRILLKSNCGVPGLDQPDSRLCMMGLLANVVIPHADTIAGLKYIARRFVADCARAERVRNPFPSRVRMQFRLAGQAARAMRRIESAEQLA